MTTIVMNLLNAAVTEYDWNFQSATPSHAASAAGLFTLGGEADNAAPITGEVRTGKTLWGSDRKKALADIYFAMKGSGTGVCRIEGETEANEYEFSVREGGVSRALPGRGIHENYLAFGYRNVAGADFRLDRIEPSTVQSKKRSAS
jgi:hypothetical protein